MLEVKAQKSYDHLIFPDTTERIILVKARKSVDKSENLSGSELKKELPTSQKIMRELNYPFHQSVIRLNQCSRNLSGNNDGPNVLFLSENQGGFPRQGIAIQSDDNLREYPKLNYVDLVISDNMFETGALDIYSHELGHVMMNNIWENFPKYISKKQHVSMGVTDYYKAFAEGWGIHFQRLAHDQIPLYQTGFAKTYNYDRTNKLWHSNVDENLRINAVLTNDYIHRKLLPQYNPSNSLKPEEHCCPIKI